jgi:hypothetical protein
MEIENLIRYPALAVGLKPSAIQGKARLRGTRTPTATLSTIGYRLSAIGSVGQSPPARNANSNGDPLDYRLSPIGSGESKTRYAQSSTETVESARGHHLERLLRVAHGLHLFQARPQAAQRHRRF